MHFVKDDRPTPSYIYIYIATGGFTSGALRSIIEIGYRTRISRENIGHLSQVRATRKKKTLRKKKRKILFPWEKNYLIPRDDVVISNADALDDYIFALLCRSFKQRRAADALTLNVYMREKRRVEYR